MTNFLKILLDYIYKKKCYFCSSSGENTIFCASCYEKISPFAYKNINNINDTKIFAASFYNGIIKKLIRGVKYHDQKELAYHQAKIMQEFWSKVQEKEKSYMVVPVPLHKNKIRKRGYNHMELVAQEFCKLTGYKIEKDLIIRIKDTKPQYKLTKQERENNLTGAFEINKQKISKEPVLLLDDITTTGSTFLEMIKELQKNNLFNITAFATAIPESNSIYSNE